MMYLLYKTVTGQAVSYGSVLADPMPADLTLRPMTDDETVGVFDGRLVWDAQTLTFITNLDFTPSSDVV